MSRPEAPAGEAEVLADPLGRDVFDSATNPRARHLHHDTPEGTPRFGQEVMEPAPTAEVKATDLLEDRG